MGVQKLLLPFGGKSVIAHIVDQLKHSIIDEIYVVVGYKGNRIAEQISGRCVSVVTNHNYRDAMLSSVRCGLHALPRCEAVLVALGDQPSITSGLVDEMVQTFTTTDKGILVPLYQGKQGHPILFSAHYCDEILTRYDDIGLRGLMREHPEDVFTLSVSSSAVLRDMNYPQDYRRELALLEKKA